MGCSQQSRKHQRGTHTSGIVTIGKIASIESGSNYSNEIIDRKFAIKTSEPGFIRLNDLL